MYNLLSKNELCISVDKKIGHEDTPRIVVHIQSDYNGNAHKERLYVNGKQLVEKVKAVWPQAKKASNKIYSLAVYFEEIDHYDDLTDVYTTPVVSIQRGYTNPKLREKEHGSIPKDWATTITMSFYDTSRATPIMKVLDQVIVSFMNYFDRKKLQKAIQKVLSNPEESGFNMEANA